MSKHHVSRATLHEDLIDIERRQCEKVNMIFPDPDNSDFVFVYTDEDHIETRVTK